MDYTFQKYLRSNILV